MSAPHADRDHSEPPVEWDAVDYAIDSAAKDAELDRLRAEIVRLRERNLSMAEANAERLHRTAQAGAEYRARVAATVEAIRLEARGLRESTMLHPANPAVADWIEAHLAALEGSGQ